jgi:ribosomal protein S18 acetylase RimI-like enzyme
MVIPMAAQETTLSRYRIRPARPQDVGALAQVHVSSWHHAYRGILAPHNLALTNFSRSVSRFRGYFWHGGQNVSLLHVVEGAEGVVGYVNSGLSNSRDTIFPPIEATTGERAGPTFNGPIQPRGEVFELYLHPDAHGRGAGRKLLSAGLWALSGRRLLPAIVWVLADNHRARRFYEGMRGREIARSTVMVGDQTLEQVAYVWVDYLPWPEWSITA